MHVPNGWHRRRQELSPIRQLASMTSILINSFREREERAETLKKHAQDGCPFCAIIQGELPAFKVTLADCPLTSKPN